MPDQIGSKTEWIVIQKANEVVDSEGQPIKTWVNYANTWARLEFLFGKELEAMQKIAAETSVRFTTNYRKDLVENPDQNAEKMRIVSRHLNWNCHAFLPTENKFDMQVLASVVH
jgi:SPP1 family predicted phage head-tail adaptor